MLLTSAAWSAGLAMLVAGLMVCAPHWLAPPPGSDSILPMLGWDAATRRLLTALLGLGLPLATARG